MLKAILSGLLKFIASMPLPMVHGLGRFVGFVFGNVVRHHREDAFEALERSMPELSRSRGMTRAMAATTAFPTLLS